MQDDEPLSYTDPTGNSTELIPVVPQSERKILLQRYPGTGDVPKEFIIDGNLIVVRPIPNQEITYTFRYYRKDPTIPAAGATTLWSRHFSNLLMNMAGKEIAWSLSNEAAFQRFNNDLNTAYQQFRNAVIAREESGMEHTMGDP